LFADEITSDGLPSYVIYGVLEASCRFCFKVKIKRIYSANTRNPYNMNCPVPAILFPSHE
jgi:hypothetical protein